MEWSDRWNGTFSCRISVIEYGFSIFWKYLSERCPLLKNNWFNYLKGRLIGNCIRSARSKILPRQFIRDTTLIDSYSIMKYRFDCWVKAIHERYVHALSYVSHGGERHLHTAAALWENVRRCAGKPKRVELAGLAGLVGPQAAKRGKYNVLEYRKSLALQSYCADADYLFLAKFQSEYRPRVELTTLHPKKNKKNGGYGSNVFMNLRRGGHRNISLTQRATHISQFHS